MKRCSVQSTSSFCDTTSQVRIKLRQRLRDKYTMIHIKRFIDRIAHVEGRAGKDLVMPLTDARALRDELSKLLADNLQLLSDSKEQEVIQVEVTGGKF